MTKLLRGEKTGLNTGLSAVKYFIVFFFPLFYTYSQVPINGFCRFNSYPVEPECDGLFAANFNNDSYTDLVLFSSHKKKVSVYAGAQNGSFQLKKTSSIPFEISNIQNLTDKNKLPLGQIVISRKSRKLALAKISSYGTLTFSEITKLNSFPENVCYSDANKDGMQEVLVSGSAFEGLSLFVSTPKGYKEKKIVRKACFSQTAFCDLNNDTYSDIAAFNIFSKKLIFFYNNSRGDFREVRNIQFDRQISQLQSVNIDFDYYQDLVFAKDKSINFLFGDSVSSFYSSLTIQTMYKPDKFIFGDFNKDGKLDIAYISTKDSILSVIYQKNNREFYPEMIYFRKEGIVNIIPYYSKFIDGFAVLSSKGELYTVTKITPILDDVQLTAGLNPTLIGSFDKENNNIFDVYYVDQKLQTLNLVVRNNTGVPSVFYPIKLYQVPDRIEVDNTDKSIKTFYCFSTDKKLIEIIRVDFLSNKIEHNSLYSPGGIKDLKVKRQPDNNIADIYVVYSKFNNLGFAQYQYKDFHYIVANNTELVKNIYDAKLSIGKTQYCYAWYWNNNKIILSKITLNNNFSPVNLFSLDSKNISSIGSLMGDILNLDKDFFVSFLWDGSQNSVLVNSEKITRLIKKNEVPENLAIEEIKKFYVGESRFNKLKKVYVFNSDQNAVYVLDFIKKGKNLIFTKLIDAENVNGFFVKNMSGKDYHIVYTDGSEHNIRIKKL